MNPNTVSLVLGSGGARGYAHIGVIRALTERGYDIRGVSGCSMGAMVGGVYCAGKLDAFEQWARSLTYLEVIKLVDLSFLSSGAIRGDKVFSLLKDMLEDAEIEDLPKPFTAVATDLTNQKEVWFRHGPLEEAIRASCAIPSLIKPVVSRGRLLVDGGVLNPLPIAPSVSVHANHVIAVDLSAEVAMPRSARTQNEARARFEVEEKRSWVDSLKAKALDWMSDKDAEAGSYAVNDGLGKLDVMYQMFETMQASLTQYKIAGYRPDLLIRVPKDSLQIYEFYRAEQQIQLGYDIAHEALEAYENGVANAYGLSG